MKGANMANDSMKLASVLDRRIRTVLEETLRGSFAKELRDLVRAEMMGAFGINTVKNTAVVRTPRKAKAARRAAAVGATCNIAGCNSPHRSRGYCSAHYQAARKHGWPMPAPVGFEPPARERARKA
jgi:hypothetical protein